MGTYGKISPITPKEIPATRESSLKVASNKIKRMPNRLIGVLPQQFIVILPYCGIVGQF
jgi:hypothetical protein